MLCSHARTRRTFPVSKAQTAEIKPDDFSSRREVNHLEDEITHKFPQILTYSFDTDSNPCRYTFLPITTQQMTKFK